MQIFCTLILITNLNAWVFLEYFHTAVLSTSSTSAAEQEGQHSAQRGRYPRICAYLVAVRRSVHCPVSVQTWTGVFGVLGGHNDAAAYCRDTGPVWQEGWWNKPSACPSLWGSVSGGSALCPAAENTCCSPLCLWFCGSDGPSRAGGDLCDPWWALRRSFASKNRTNTRAEVVFRFSQLAHTRRSQSTSTAATSCHRKDSAWVDNKPAW